MINPITTFKIRIDKITANSVSFELFAGERVRDTYVNALTGGGYGIKGRILLTPKQFADFAQRLIAYVYVSPSHVSYIKDDQLKILWDLKLNIFTNENPKTSTSIFMGKEDKLKKLTLLGKE